MMKAVIPAAGLGLRFLPATKAQPKEMLPVVDKPCIQYVVEEAVAAGIKDIIIITGRGKSAIEDHFDRSIELEQRLTMRHHKKLAEDMKQIAELADIFFIRQKEPLGLGHAVLCAKSHLRDEPFAVLLGDDMILNDKTAIGQLMQTFEKTGRKSIVGVERVAKSVISKYGVIDGEEIKKGLYKIKNLVEKPAPGKEPSDLAIIGRYIFTPAIFEFLEKTKKGRNGEIQLTDAMRMLAKRDDMYAQMIKGRRFDLGDKFDWIKANVQIALERPELRDDMQEWVKKEFCR